MAAAVRTPPVVVDLVLSQDRPQMPFAEDQHLVGDLGPSGEHEPFRISVRARAAGRGSIGYSVGSLLGRDPGAVSPGGEVILLTARRD
jgi:hypothetical protein